MTHPEELLAGYVDGALSEKERAVVDVHLQMCETCREEIELATRARGLLAELPEASVPVGVTAPVMEEVALQMSRRMARPRPSPWRARVAWAAGLAAAAAFVAVLAVNGLGGGTGGTGAAPGTTPGAEPVAGGAAATAKVFVPLERQPDVNYDSARVAELAGTVASQVPGIVSSAPAPSGSAESADSALVCIAKGSSITANDRPVEVIDARYEGKPAYLAVFLESPGANQPPTKVIIWIVAKRGCVLISFASQRV